MLDRSVQPQSERRVGRFSQPGCTDTLPKGGHAFFRSDHSDGSSDAEGFVVTGAVGAIAGDLQTSLDDINRMAGRETKEKERGRKCPYQGKSGESKRRNGRKCERNAPLMTDGCDIEYRKN